MPTAPRPFGLYLHIPYCASLCSYCDFAKTANWGAAVQADYLQQLERHLVAWTSLDELQPALAGGLHSVFLGGGTPSLFAGEYQSLFSRLRPLLRADTEVSLEANPDDITIDRLAVWQQLGVNRLSLGIQTFAAAGLKQLGRQHSAAQAQAAVALARSVFPELNIDLIYGWAGQTRASWRADLQTAVALGVRHLSLYNLTYEGRTPLARQAGRGRLTPTADDDLAELFNDACQLLGAAEFAHDEVSNWSLPGASCKHNWLYWQDHGYIGIGAGAHGYLPDLGAVGLRYAYARNDRTFIRHQLGERSEAQGAKVSPWAELAQSFGISTEHQRGPDEWLTELVGSGLRTSRGVDLAAALARTGRVLRPTPILARGLSSGLLTYQASGRMTLAKAEWFREAAWATELLCSLQPAP